MLPLDPSVQQLLDKQAITERIYDYARSMDRLDPGLGKGCFHEDALADYGEQMFQGTGYGFIDVCMITHLQFQSHSHQFSDFDVSGPASGTFTTTGKRDRTDVSYFGQ